ncbi:hypothetical protein F441_07301 [Phytophthora nicotianae CJ01A1]|uniref:Uncharacterized protein n=4 Tax=Phytophthora nicotianae TaxID=4792 RepID=W2ZHD2_PHYNI|nr:hypothetical protein L915_07160 [Phytophthora nicotianae]ETL42008.1 hypothetical protein L916_07111 [Phytophthora nicotianae]ETO77443.1 hypothetical protein F444_07360 [Phytophthora nicotianae P1976]ETP18487.1 hypothetical protein F441_07301 [Phytophthora nicotianae CJ01A1]ETP46391.1 hypothetical protein F442_07360 [Phytophthora nicotianae P10297]
MSSPDYLEFNQTTQDTKFTKISCRCGFSHVRTGW